MANKKGLTDFKASMTWVQKFMDRNGFTIRRKTTQSQRLPPELSKKVSNFFFYLRKYYKQHPEITNAKIIAIILKITTFLWLTNKHFFLVWKKKKMKSALECNPHSNVIRNFWEKKKKKSADCFRVFTVGNLTKVVKMRHFWQILKDCDFPPPFVHFTNKSLRPKTESRGQSCTFKSRFFPAFEDLQEGPLER